MITEQEAIDGLTRYYQALDASIPARPPDWHPQPRRGWRAASWPVQLLATAALLFLIVGAGILIHEAQVMKRTNPVATPSPQVRAFQSMVLSDQQAFAAASGASCQSIQTTGCPAAITALTVSTQHWLDDLDRSRPPARFAPVVAELHRNLSMLITDLNAMRSAFDARDQNALDTSRNAGAAEDQLIQDEAIDIAHAYQGTATAYRYSVRDQVTMLHDCGLCQAAISEGDAACTSYLARCRTNLDASLTTVDEMQGELIRVYAPDSMTAKEGRLQADLTAADSALRTMMAALSATQVPVPSDIAAPHRALVSALAQFVVDANSNPS